MEALKRMGLKVGDNVKIMGGVKIDYGHCKHISIGNNVTIAPDVYLLAHDASMYNVKKYTRIGKIIIGDNVFIGLRSVVMPNVRIGENSIIGAGSLVNKSIPKNVVAVGNPIKIICSVEDFYKNRSLLKESILPEDIAEGIYFFASSKSKKSTGNIINVDGGNITSFTR